MADTLYYTTHESRIGKLLMVAGPRGVRYLTMISPREEVSAHLDRRFSTPPKATLVELDGFFKTSAAAIDRHLDGEGELSLPYELDGGTPLQRMVWIALAKIPYGATISYSELAEKVGFPRAVRAVASACGANPIPLIIPCHRVVAKDGTLGGFSLGGLEVKEKLLKVESAKLKAAEAA